MRETLTSGLWGAPRVTPAPTRNLSFGPAAALADSGCPCAGPAEPGPRQAHPQVMYVVGQLKAAMDLERTLSLVLKHLNNVIEE